MVIKIIGDQSVNVYIAKCKETVLNDLCKTSLVNVCYNNIQLLKI